MDGPHVSVIVPTYKEGENLAELAARVHAALDGQSYELLIVDDSSPDRTPAVCAELAQTYPLRLIVRADRSNGLSGAVLRGFAESKGRIIAVMDGDLQHPPEMLPKLIAALEDGQGDFALGSRYAAGGTTEHNWGLFRQINSKVATLLARPFAGPIADPMSGFFALSRATYERGRRLTPLGYKIALELICKCRVKKVVEVPIHFARRQRGESKLSLREQFRYLEHLSRLYDFTFPRLSPYAKFLIATLISWLVGLGALLGVVHLTASGAAAIAAAYPAVIAATAVFHLRYVRTQREFILGRHPWLAFWIISLAEWLVCALAAMWLSRNLAHPTIGTLLTLSFGCATVARYILRKEMGQDLRGLRRDLRREELAEEAR